MICTYEFDYIFIILLTIYLLSVNKIRETNMRSRKALANISTSFLLQIITLICGFIVPKLLINTFGSNAYGVIASITQFLAYIAILEAGVGGVTRVALYKPVSIKDESTISGIIKASEIFFRRLSYFFISYLVILALAFPIVVKNDFGWFYTFLLVIIIGLSTFSQYYFGVSYQLLLKADQKEYITMFIQIATVILNTVIIVILVKLNTSIHIVKLGSTIVYAIRPIFLHYYVVKKYHINKKCKPNLLSLKQKWDALGHHIAFYIHHNTDIVVLTFFTTLKEVSVYSIYYMVVMSIGKIVRTMSVGIESAFGNMIAKDEKDVLNRSLKIYEFISYVLCVIVFTSAAVLIMSFITVYTSGITDANYYRPLFAIIMILAEAIYCIRLPYHSIVIAAGHFKQTRNGAFAEAGINIIISVLLVNHIGIVGVAIGTLCAMTIRTIQYAFYLSKNIIHRSVNEFLKRILVSVMCVILIIFISKNIPLMEIKTYFEWAIYAVIITAISIVVTITINVAIYKEDFKNIIAIFKRIYNKRVI